LIIEILNVSKMLDKFLFFKHRV